MAYKSKEQEECEKLFPAFDFDEFNYLTYSEMSEFHDLLEKYIITTESAMKASPFQDHDMEDLKDPDINLSLEKAISWCSGGSIIDWDGCGCWYLYDKKEDKYYFSQESFSCQMLLLKDNDYINFDLGPKPSEEQLKEATDNFVKLLHKHFDRYGLEIKGVMWYNK